MKKRKIQQPTLLQATEEVFRTGGIYAPSPREVDQPYWHDRVQKLSEQVSPGQLSEAAFNLLGQVPLGEAIDVIEDIKRGRNTKTGLKRLTMIRKCCYVARDLMILTSEESPRKQAKPLYDTCHYLGFIADSDGLVGKKRTIQAIEDLKDLRKDWRKEPPELGLNSQQGFEAAVADRLESAELLIWGSDGVTYDAYHEARKDFRRVLAVAVMGVTALGHEDFRSLALEGVALSNWHGRTKDELCALEQQQLLAPTEELIPA